jgi:hypothetical protein
MVTDFTCGPGDLPVSTFTLIVPALPGWRTFGKSTVVHPQPGWTFSMSSSALPALRIWKLRTIVLPCGCLPNSMVCVGATSLGALPVAETVAGAAPGGGAGLPFGRIFCTGAVVTEVLALLVIAGLSRIATGGAALLLGCGAALLLDEAVSSGDGEHPDISSIIRTGMTQSFLRLLFIAK